MGLNPLKRARAPQTDGVGVYATLSAAIAPRIEEIFDAFYAELATDPGKTTLLRDPATAARARDANLEHWKFLLANPPGEEFKERSRRIGQTHVRVKLSPEIYIGAYGYFVKNFLRVILARHVRESELVEALTESVFTDMGANLERLLQRHGMSCARTRGARAEKVNRTGIGGLERGGRPPVRGLAGDRERS